MRVISPKKISDFVLKNAHAKVPLYNWLSQTKKADWNKLADIKQTFNSVDYVGNQRYVFNIGRNNYRLVALILFEGKRVYIRFIGTHQEYDNIDCSKI